MAKEESLLKQIYDSDMNPCIWNNPDNPNWKSLKKACTKSYEKITQKLSIEQIKELEELKNMEFDLEEIEIEHAFKQGVTLGIKLMIEILIKTK